MAKKGIDLIKKESFFRSVLGAKARGDISEARTEEALERLKRRGRIVDYIRATGMNLWDRRGVDFIIILPVGAHYKTIYLQIKSSLIGVIKHKNAMARTRMRKREIKNMFNIPVIIINERDSTEDISVRILKKIRRES